MLSQQLLDKIEKVAQEIAVREGCTVYDVEYTGGPMGKTLCVYLDKTGNTVGIDECSKVSRELNEILDTEGFLPEENYVLEVSSPGLERVLSRPAHFQSVVGKKIYVKTSQSAESLGLKNSPLKLAKQFNEVLHSADETGIVFKLDEQELKIPFTVIEKAHLVFEFEAKGEKKGNTKKNQKR